MHSARNSKFKRQISSCRPWVTLSKGRLLQVFGQQRICRSTFRSSNLITSLQKPTSEVNRLLCILSADPCCTSPPVCIGRFTLLNTADVASSTQQSQPLTSACCNPISNRHWRSSPSSWL
ncbi:hypothetical protein LIA77_06133 [Sarocladium implicatum]|nr:hypothetical protein LIA77_06133 [Sarocladium implicatum]